MPTSILGNAVPRLEDPRLLTGAARYVDDLPLQGALHAVFVRSTVPHARIGGIEVGEAAAMPGVVGVFTAADLGLAPWKNIGFMPDAMARPPLAEGVVRFAGEAVAVVVAESRAQAVDAAEAVAVDYDPLPAVADPEAALAPGAPLLFPDHGSNVAFTLDFGDDPDLFADADVVVRARFVNQRLAPVPLEVGACAAVPEGDGLVVYASTQAPHALRDEVAKALGLPEDRVRVIAPAVGGGFGPKGSPAPEHLVVAAAARRLGRPVRWVESRSESMLAMTHGRGQVQEVEVGARRDGTVVGLRARILQDCGAYPQVGALLPFLTRQMACGVYAIPKVVVTAKSVVTNTTPTSAYRGAGRPEAAAMVERAMDLVAAELGLDPAEVRRRNFIPPDAFPYTTPTGATYDVGDYRRALELALESAGYEDLRRAQQARRERGDVRQLGIGLSCYVEITGLGGETVTEYGSVEVGEDGTVTVLSGASAHGQGHETAFAQIAADRLGVPLESVRVIQSDTALVPRGVGTFGSRSAQLGGSAVLRAAGEVVEKAKLVAAHLLEVSPEDLVVSDGGIGVAGVPSRRIAWAELARAARDPDRLPPGAEPGLRADVDFVQDAATFPFGAHVAVVEVDTETGDARLVRFVAVDDCGRRINPLLVEGQEHGGIAQGVAQALYEGFVYDSDANPLTASLAHYLVPSAAELPSFECVPMETPTPLNPLGAKGIGESGTIGATPAVQNAVVDALAHLGVRHLDMPLSPERIWRAIAQARGGEGPGGSGSAGSSRGGEGPGGPGSAGSSRGG